MPVQTCSWWRVKEWGNRLHHMAMTFQIILNRFHDENVSLNNIGKYHSTSIKIRNKNTKESSLKRQVETSLLMKNTIRQNGLYWLQSRRKTILQCDLASFYLENKCYFCVSNTNEMGSGFFLTLQAWGKDTPCSRDVKTESTLLSLISGYTQL